MTNKTRPKRTSRLLPHSVTAKQPGNRSVSNSPEARRSRSSASPRNDQSRWPVKVAAFQANLKVGDRLKWGRALIWGGPFVGMVVKVEGALAVVQFDTT